MPYPVAAVRQKRGVAAFSPSGIAGLLIWYAARLETAYSDTNAVGTLTDQSGNGNNVSAAGDARATYKTSIVNSQAIYRFDGTDDSYTLADLVSGLSAAEVFLVFKIDNDPPAVASLTGLWDFGTSVDDNHWPFTDSSVYAGFMSSTRYGTGNPSADLSTAFRLVNIISTSSEWTMNIDTAQHYTSGSNTVAGNSGPTIGSGDASVFLDGDIAEICLFNAKLSSGYRSSMEAYFDRTYALSY